MAYVQPNSVIQLFRGINLDNRYLHTIYFANASAQNSWFSGKVYKTYQGQSYTRYTRNQIKIKDDATSLLDCTYMRFMNDRAVDKWFYAFINAVEYINENTALVTYEIDVMQTWFIQNGSIRPCRVLREHVNDDTFGVNLEAEPCGSDVYKMDLITRSNLFTATSLIVNTTPTRDPSSTDVVNNDLFNCTEYMTATCRDAQGNVDANALANIASAIGIVLGGNWDVGQQSATLIDLFTFPTEFAHKDVQSNIHTITVNHPLTMGAYTPKNKKLLTYPYTYLGGTTKDGDSGIYRWEYFAGINTAGQVTFKAYGSPIAGGQIMCYPHTYDGVIDNIDCKLVMDNFPKNPFAYDAYQAWVASGGKTKWEMARDITNIRGLTALAKSASNVSMGQGMNGVASAGRNAYAMEQNGGATAGLLAGMTGGLNQTIQSSLNYVNTTLDVLEAKNKIAYQFADVTYAPSMLLSNATPNLAVSLDELDFHFFNVHVEEDEAKRLDDFFSCFGYRVNRVKTPNITGRAYWNFVQTENCVIAGDMPSSSKEAIARIFDGGITFWHNGDNVGNYSISISDGTINNPIV